MSRQIFQDAPTVELLQWLARGSLKQNLPRAARLWVWLRSLYGGEKERIELPETFSYAQWRDAFFTKTHPKGEEIPTLHDRNCPCSKTAASWLFDGKAGIPERHWRATLARHDSEPENLEELLQQRLFGVTRRTLAGDLRILADLGWLQRHGSSYAKVLQWPVRPGIEKAITETQVQVAELLQVLDFDKLMLVYPEVAPIAEDLYGAQLQEGTRRVFLHFDYILPDETKEAVDDLQYELQELWKEKSVKPVMLRYRSAKLSKTVERATYPVCIYYVQRAKYLCAFGETPAGKVGWYNWRLDRVEEIEILEWSDARVPSELRELYEKKKLPEPEYIQKQMEDAWGFDFYQPAVLMVLRFERSFYDRYIAGTFRHDTFEAISYEQAGKLIEKNAPDLVGVWKKRSRQDAYCSAMYRDGDPNLEMRLRSWRPNVEVLLPKKLRQSVALEVEREAQFYGDLG